MNVKEAMEIMSEALYHTNNPVSAEAIKISLEALERQILKKPLHNWHECPNCGEEVDMEAVHYYCGYCGQCLK